VGGVLVICTETTQQVAAARRVASERERLARLFEQAPGFMVMLSGPDHRIELANPAYLRLIGHRDVLGRPVAEALPEAAGQGYLELLDGVYRSGKAYAASGVSYRPPRPDGSLDQRYLDFVYQPVTDDAGAVIGIFVEGADVTERIRADTALRKSEEDLLTARKAGEARLRELNERLEQRVAEALAEKKIFADIVEATDAFVQVADLGFRFLAVNKASADEFERIYGVRPKVGDSMLELLDDQPEHRAAVAAIWGRALCGEEFTATGEFGDTARDRRHYEMKFNTLRDKDGRRVGAYQFVYDVTDRIRAQERLARAEDALRQAQKMEAVGRLTGGIAHDFNNLLHAVQGSLQLIRRVPSDERVQVWAANALRSIKRGAELTSQLLTFAREQQLEPRPLNVWQLVNDMEDMIRRSLGPLVHLETASTVKDATVHADATQLEMAVLNLAINARDAMPEGGSLTIASHARRIDEHPSLQPGDYVELAVSDTGAGMPAEVVARAFDPFFTTKGVGKGTGLGLSQVYGMARQAGGGATIRSEMGKGTTVTLLLPRSEPSHLAPSPPSASAGLDTAQPQSRILVVDDDPEVRSILVASLEILGHAVTAAEDGAAGLKAIDAAEPDLMIVDYAMPGLNGAEVADRARARHSALPIILASGYADKEALEAAAGSSSAILRKPFDIEELETTVRDLLKRSRQPASR
jgi:PAS domain S-box-containing protein